MDWDKLRIFHAVAKAGSFTHGGEALNLSQSAVSRQIASLEESLGTPLFLRHARGLVLTEQGKMLFRTASDVAARLSLTEGLLSETQESPKGDLRINTTVGFGSVWLTSHMRAFIDRYPDIHISLMLTDMELDLTMGEADVGIHVRRPTQPGLIQRRLNTMQFHIYGSSAYLAKYGTPRSVDDLDKHRIIVYGEMATTMLKDVNWLAKVGKTKGRREPVMRVNSIYGTMKAVRRGIGLAALPDYAMPDDAHLVRVLPEIEGPKFETYFVYPETLRDSARVCVFRDYLIHEVSEQPF